VAACVVQDYRAALAAGERGKQVLLEPLLEQDGVGRFLGTHWCVILAVAQYRHDVHALVSLAGLGAFCLFALRRAAVPVLGRADDATLVRTARILPGERITDDDLRDLASQLENGQADANLGAGVYKMRVARSDEGKSSGYRAIVFFRSGRQKSR